MAKDLKLANIEAKDEESHAEILAAFSAMYANPKELDAEGKETGKLTYTPEQLVKHHTNNFIRSVVSQHRQALKRAQIETAGEVAKDFVKA